MENCVAKNNDNGKAGGSASKNRRFYIDALKLPDRIADKAFGSGGYPYGEKLARKKYERELLALQIELAEVQGWVAKTGESIVIVWEGRDAAGKGGHDQAFHPAPQS